MTLLPKVSKDDLSKLHGEVQKEYVERDGAFFLNVQPLAEKDGDTERLWVLEDVAGLKKTANDLRKKRDDAIAYGKAFGDYTPEKVAEMAGQLEELKAHPPEAKHAEIRKSVEEQLTKKFGTEISNRDGAITDLTRQLEDVLVTGSARAAIAKHAKTPEAVELLLPHVLRRVGMKKSQDGKYREFVKSKDGGEEPTRKGTSMEPMGFEELVESMKTEPIYAPAFPGSGITGSGARGSNGTGGPKPSVNQDLSPVERLKQERRQRVG